MKGRPNYNHPWISDNGKIVPTLPARNYYGLDSDHLNTSSQVPDAGPHPPLWRWWRTADPPAPRHTYERDLLASTIGFATPRPTALDQINDSTALTRGSKGRIGESTLTQLQSDYTNAFVWGGKSTTSSPASTSTTTMRCATQLRQPTARPGTTVGTPNNGDSVADGRAPVAFNTFKAQNLGLYLQDTLSLNSTVKLIGGLRYDQFKASYRSATGALTNEQSEGLWSPRIGALYQPNELSSYYVSYGTSYNTSGDTYQFGINLNDNTGRTARTPPKRAATSRSAPSSNCSKSAPCWASRPSTARKFNERNTDPDVAAAQELLSGARHAAGMEFNLAGRFTPKWEIFVNHTWIPSAKIDKSNVALNASRYRRAGAGRPPALTPRHSGSVWSTYAPCPSCAWVRASPTGAARTPKAPAT